MKQIMRLGLVILIAVIMTLGYGGWCEDEKNYYTTNITSGSSEPPPPAPWTKQLGTGLDDEALDVTTDNSGNIYVAGWTKGGLDGNTNVGNTDLFVVKYNTDGDRQWTEQLGTPDGDVAYGVATDTSGNIYLTGYTVGTFTGFTNLGGYDILVVKYNTDGDWQWTEQLGTAANEEAKDIATDTSGNVYVTGYTNGALTGTNFGGADIFVVKYNADGDWQWTQQLGSATSEKAFDVTTDTSGNVYVTGYTAGALTGTNFGGYDIFVVKYGSSRISVGK